MTQEGFKRKLTSIFSADAVGYSRLMGEDEVATVHTLTSYRKVIATLVQQHSGTVIDSPGDNLLAEFISVVASVQCGVAVQKELKARNDELPENRKMQFRIGINLGDVIQEGDRIYGDGVNIAARLEGLSEPGGICISKTTFDHIESKLPLGYEFLGDQYVKNISKPIGAYRVIMEPRVTNAKKLKKQQAKPVRRMFINGGVVAIIFLAFALGIWKFYMRQTREEPAAVDKMTYPLPDRPSIAVLPFDNLSGDTEQDYFSDGMTDDLITDLSKISGLFVMARNSTFFYKKKSFKIKQVAEELGVRYVLEGSIRKAENLIRINAQLIDGLTGGHLWAERYDGKMDDVFALDYIKKAMRIDPEYPAYYLVVLGLSHFSLEQFAEARSLFERSLERNPENYIALIPLAATYIHLGLEEKAKAGIKRLYEIFPIVTLALIEKCPLWQYRNLNERQRLLSGLERAGMAKTHYDLLE